MGALQDPVGGNADRCRLNPWERPDFPCMPRFFRRVRCAYHLCGILVRLGYMRLR